MYNFKGHTSKLNQIILSEEQKTLYSCSDDGTIRFWNIITGKEVKIIETNS